jgi:hypothetical protein
VVRDGREWRNLYWRPKCTLEFEEKKRVMENIRAEIYHVCRSTFFIFHNLYTLDAICFEHCLLDKPKQTYHKGWRNDCGHLEYGTLTYTQSERVDEQIVNGNLLK